MRTTDPIHKMPFTEYLEQKIKLWDGYSAEYKEAGELDIAIKAMEKTLLLQRDLNEYRKSLRALNINPENN